MRDEGAFVESAIACGHSVGEYTAVACVTGVFELEALIEVVFQRGCKMHDIVPRDEMGRSNYRLAAIRASQMNLDDADVKGFVAEIAERTGEFLQIVNYNLRGSRYAIAGTVAGLDALKDEVDRRLEISGGKRAYIQVPGIDVPFHSDVLRVGVPEFRRSLERIIPEDADPRILIDHYTPEPGAASVQPQPRVHPGDPRPGSGRAARRDPGRLRHLDHPAPQGTFPKGARRTSRLAVRQPGALVETQDLLFTEEGAGGSAWSASSRSA